ncbi:hypothetical protein [Streptomyces sp. NBC_01171]|uniref:hypothetical protein n=1 Tax=Streptomyces sp. NBC_01171 TaxID=2903757 RepID=UPI00386BE073|nr:hypothetical protein OG448_29965 [Streptomyces sp. NBC_01171]
MISAVVSLMLRMPVSARSVPAAGSVRTNSLTADANRRLAVPSTASTTNAVPVMLHVVIVGNTLVQRSMATRHDQLTVLVEPPSVAPRGISVGHEPAHFWS